MNAELKPLRRAHFASWKPKLDAALAQLPETKAEQLEREMGLFRRGDF